MSIAITHLDFVYQPGTTSERHALRDISLTIGDGEIVGIVGASGSGKSTLIQHLNGAILPPPGTVFINGLELKKGVSNVEMVKQVGLVFQYSEHQLFAETVAEEIAYGCRNLGFSEEYIEKISEEVLTAVGLDRDYLRCSPFSLSGGEKRRVTLASMLAMDPSIYVFDEPTVGLDWKGKTMVRNLIRRLHQVEKTVLIVGHDMAEICPMVQRLVILSHGSVVSEGRTEAVLRRTDLAQYGIVMPKSFEPRKMLEQRFPEMCHSEAAGKILAFLEGGGQ